MREVAKYVGIDPGKSGAIVVLHEDNTVEKHMVPILDTKKNIIDVHAYAQIFLSLSGPNVFVAKEKVHAIHGSSASAMFTFGNVVGLIDMGLSLCEIKYIEVAPKQWQKYAWQGVTPITYMEGLKKKTDTKGTSLVACKRLFPKVDLRKSERARNPHDGVVDALLIAHFCRNHFK